MLESFDVLLYSRGVYYMLGVFVVALVVFVATGPAFPEGGELPGFVISERTIVLDDQSPVSMIRVGPLHSTDSLGRRYADTALHGPRHQL